MKFMPIIFVTALVLVLVPGVYTKTLPIKRGLNYCIPKLCDIDHYAIPCKATDHANPGEDKCFPCDNNSINPTRINTANIPFEYANQTCFVPNCKCGLEENILANEEECKKTGIIKCVCDRSKRWCSPDPNTCQKWLGNKTDIKKNHELSQNCNITRCEEGSSKPAGDGVCKKDAATEAQNTTPPSNNKDEDDGLLPKILILVGSLVLVAIIIIGIIHVLRKQRGMNMKPNRDGANPGDHELRDMMPNGRQQESV